jgi:hypothetical protein
VEITERRFTHMAYENLQKKFGVTEEQIKSGVDIVSKKLGEICNSMVMIAIAELLVNGDITDC